MTLLAPCAGLFPPLIGWSIFAVNSLVLAYLLVWRPLRKNYKKLATIISISSFVVLYVGLFLLFLLVLIQKCPDYTPSGDVSSIVLAKLRAAPDKVSWPLEFRINRGRREVTRIGVQNVESKELFFKLNLLFDDINSDQGYDGFSIRYDQSCFTLLPAEANVYEISVGAPLIPGTFALRADVLQFTDDKCVILDSVQPKYDTKLSFIRVN